MQKKSKLYVFTKAKDLAKYILTVTEKSPVKFRYSLTIRLHNYILDAIECIYFANKSDFGEERTALQKKARNLLSTLDYFSGIAYEQGCILLKQYEQISLQIAETIMYLDKWSKVTSNNS